MLLIGMSIGVLLVLTLMVLAVMATIKWPLRQLVTLTVFCWVGYLPYEYLMYMRVLCSGECNIRVDLLLIYPILLTLTIGTLARGVRAARRAKFGAGG